MNTKICTICKNEKYVDNFYKKNRWIYWVSAFCKECKSKKDWEYYIINRERIINRVSGYNKTDKWREIHRLVCSNRRAAKATTSDWTITILSTKKLLDNQWWCCTLCWLDINERTARHLDHIHPLAKWWTHTLDNVQWLCCKCNLTKSDKI